jgi:hypothetical protein
MKFTEIKNSRDIALHDMRNRARPRHGGRPWQAKNLEPLQTKFLLIKFDVLTLLIGWNSGKPPA